MGSRDLGTESAPHYNFQEVVLGVRGAREIPDEQIGTGSKIWPKTPSLQDFFRPECPDPWSPGQKACR